MTNRIVQSHRVGGCLEWGGCELKGRGRRARGLVVVVSFGQQGVTVVGAGSGEFSVSCCFKNCEGGFCWSFTQVYRPTLKFDREGFWSELETIKGMWSDPWCVASDFNMIRFPLKHNRGGKLPSTMKRFSEVIEDLELRDLPLQGGLFT